MDQEDDYNRSHSAHDVDELTRRWFDVASACGWRMAKFSREGDAAIYALASPDWDGHTADVYLCAGVHGDEPAAAWGMLAWVEANRHRMSALNGLIVPCLNPRGMAANTRVDGAGRDLNRLFHEDCEPVIREWKSLVGEARFKLALTLHEDYDAQGCYVYEIRNTGKPIAEEVLAATDAFIARDGRGDIDGSPARNGIIRRDIVRSDFDEMGFPEAVYLHFHHADHTLTFETPSEFSLFRRVRAQQAAIDGALRAAGIVG